MSSNRNLFISLYLFILLSNVKEGLLFLLLPPLIVATICHGLATCQAMSHTCFYIGYLSLITTYDAHATEKEAEAKE